MDANFPRWTRGPEVEPLQALCQICKADTSIYGRVAREILCHHSTKKHLRKDQRWRYEDLYKVDPVTKTNIHHVRGKDVTLLTPYQLELKLPDFNGVEFVEIGQIGEIGQNLYFCDEYVVGMDYHYDTYAAKMEFIIKCKVYFP